MNGIPIKYDNSLMKVKKSNKSWLNSFVLPWNRFMRNSLSISKIIWPHLKGDKLISGDWSAAGITNALKNGKTCLVPLDPFADIDSLVSEPSVEQDDSNILQIDKGHIQYLPSKDEKDSCDSEREFGDWNIFDVTAQELWFVTFIDFLQSCFQNTLHWT